jgi:RHS repeat-associated protein
MTNTTYWFPECHYRSSQGRWLSPDPAGMAAVDPSDPQTWNRYAYVRNSPLNKIDLQGLDGWDEGWGGGGDGGGWGDGGWGVNCTLSLLRSRVERVSALGQIRFEE